MGPIKIPTSCEDLKLLQSPLKEETISEIRVGREKPCFSTQEPSAIYKTPRQGPIKLSLLGLESDEHVFHLHGGPDKALLQYSTLHYDSWKSELPQSRRFFNVGGFGENLVTKYANERNVCIGDIMEIGDTGVRIQVTGGRQPCYKLNHRFQVKDMARRSQELARTGWFYRVLTEGTIEAGDRIGLLERKNPEWSVARVQHYLYIEMRNFEVMKVLVGLEGLGVEGRTIFENRLRRKFENMKLRLLGGEDSALKSWRDYRLVGKKRETENIIAFTFETVDKEEEPKKVEPGSHVRLRLRGDLLRAYSVVGGTSNRFELGVALNRETSQGGSLYIYDNLELGSITSVGTITVSFPPQPDAEHHVLIAGGIGITAFLATAKHLQSTNQSYHLHYLVHQTSDIAFSHLLKDFTPNLTIHDKSLGNPFNTPHILSVLPKSTHIYTCGSPRLMDSITSTAATLNFPSENLHFEAFAPPELVGDPFEVEIASSCSILVVGSGESLLDVLRNAGFDIPSSCEVGNCGTCKVKVKKGRVDMKGRGTGLLGKERNEGMLSCVERGVGRVVLEL